MELLKVLPLVLDLRLWHRASLLWSSHPTANPSKCYCGPVEQLVGTAGGRSWVVEGRERAALGGGVGLVVALATVSGLDI